MAEDDDEDGLGGPRRSPPSGWYEDPFDQRRHRFWAGDTWTKRVLESGTEERDPMPPPSTVPDGPPQGAEQVREVSNARVPWLPALAGGIALQLVATLAMNGAGGTASVTIAWLAMTSGLALTLYGVIRAALEHHDLGR